MTNLPPATRHLLSPYRPPTSYPVSLSEGEAAAWLNGWAALWHPAVLQNCASLPQASSSYDHDPPGPGGVYALAEGPMLYLAEDWADRLTQAGGVSFRATADRTATFGNLCAAWQAAQRTWIETSEELLQCFCGLGYDYLMVETLYDAMDHEHLLDRAGFLADLQQAIQSLGDASTARSHLKEAAAKLAAAREVIHSGTLRLLDWFILNEHELPSQWPASLQAGLPISVIGSVAALKRFSTERPELWAEGLRHAPEGLPSAIDWCIGTHYDRDDSLLPVESQLANLNHVRRDVRELTGGDVSVFARSRGSFSPESPSWLHQRGYRFAIAIPAEGPAPSLTRPTVIHWPAPDGRTLDAWTKEPLPAADAQTFFNLAYHLHKAIQNESSPALAFAHRGGAAGVGYRDLLALAELSPALGEWLGMTAFFESVGMGDYVPVAGPDDDTFDRLDDLITHQKVPDAVSRFARIQRSRRRLEAAWAYRALHRTLSEPTGDDTKLDSELQQAEAAFEQSLSISDTFETLEHQAEDRLAARIQSRSEPGRPGYLLLNPCSFARRAALELEPFPGPVAIEGPIKAAQFDPDKTRLVVEVPGWGFAWIPRTSSGQSAPKARLKQVEGPIVRNEFLEAELDPATGGLRAFRDTRLRMNRLGILPVFNPGSQARGTSLRAIHQGPALGEVLSEGQLLSEHNEPLASFSIRCRAWLGRPVLEVSCEIVPVQKPEGYPWHAYYGLRFTYRDERTALYRGAQGGNARTNVNRLVSPDYFEMRFGRERTFVFTGGLPFATKQGSRAFDLVLIPPGETATRFDLLLTLDRDTPMPTALGWTSPLAARKTDLGPPPVGASSWLAHLDQPGLMVTEFRPAEPTSGTRAVVGRMMDVMGFADAAELQFARTPASVTLIDGLGDPLHEIALAGDAVPLEYSGHETVRIRAEW